MLHRTPHGPRCKRISFSLSQSPGLTPSLKGVNNGSRLKRRPLLADKINMCKVKLLTGIFVSFLCSLSAHGQAYTASATECSQAQWDQINQLDASNTQKLDKLDKAGSQLWKQVEAAEGDIKKAYTAGNASTDRGASRDIDDMWNMWRPLEGEFKVGGPATLSDDIKNYKEDRAIMGRLAAGENVQSIAPTWYAAAQAAQGKGTVYEDLLIKRFGDPGKPPEKTYFYFLNNGAKDLDAARTSAYSPAHTENPTVVKVKQNMFNLWKKGGDLNYEARQLFLALLKLHMLKKDCISRMGATDAELARRIKSMQEGQ
jgi:hypothetical protein